MSNPTIKRTVGIISQEGGPLPLQAHQLLRILLREIAQSRTTRG